MTSLSYRFDDFVVLSVHDEAVSLFYFLVLFYKSDGPSHGSDGAWELEELQMRRQVLRGEII